MTTSYRVAFDLETHPIAPGQLAPRMVCLSYYDGSPGRAKLLDHAQALAWAFETLTRPDVVVVGANLPFDLAVLIAEAPALLPHVFRMYDEGRAQCVQTRQKLLDIATDELEFYWDGNARKKTEHSLAALADRWLGRKLDKGEDTYRLRYHELDGTPLAEWPDAAREYALKDAETTWDVDAAQQTWIAANFDDAELPNATEQYRAAWALHLMSMWGVRTDGPAVERLKDILEAEHAEADKALRAAGVVRTCINKRTGLPTKQDGTTDTAKLAERVVDFHLRLYAAERGLTLEEARKARDTVAALGEDDLNGFLGSIGVPLTETGKVSLSEDNLSLTDDPICLIKAQSSSGAKLLNTYIPILENGVRAAINARYNVLVATGRTSCSNPNMQNPPRKGGVRECFISRPGRLFADVDYDTLELRSLAQVCLDLFGQSSMADALRAGEDLHVRLAAQVLGYDHATAQKLYDAGDEQVAEMRQLCKIANFGFPGGMAWQTFVAYAAGFGTKIDPAIAIELKRAWDKAWPEMKEYFNFIGTVVGKHGLGGRIVQVRSGRIRSGVNFCSGANTLFQGLAADGAKEALWRVAQECYGIGKRTTLYGTRPCIFMHDEIVAEVPDVPGRPEVAAEAAERLALVMREAMAAWIPDVPIGAKPALMRKWFKGAKPVHKDGILLPSRPSHVVGPDGKEKTVWVADVPELEVAA